MVFVGRKPKPEDEKAVTHAIRWPPRLWARLAAVAEKLERKRSGIIHDAVTREVKRLERQAPEEKDDGS